MPIVKARESKTRSKEGILRSFRSSEHESLKIKHLRFSFLWLCGWLQWSFSHCTSRARSGRFREHFRCAFMCSAQFCARRPCPSSTTLGSLKSTHLTPGGGLGGYILPIVESRESKTRSEERILPSFRISKHKSVRRDKICPKIFSGWADRHDICTFRARSGPFRERF